MFHLKRTILALVVLAILLSSIAAQAATYYVATTGSNGNSCAQAQNVATPKQTIAGGVGCLASGDTLQVRAGTYTNQTIQNVPAGSVGAYTTIRNYPGERPRINISIPFTRGIYFDGPAFHHIEIRGFEFDGVYNVMKLDATGGYPHHINFIDNIAHDTVNVGILTSSSPNGVDGGDHLIQGNEFYNIGIGSPGYLPGINVIYNTGNRTIVERNIIHDSCAGIIIYTGSDPVHDVVIRNNVLYDMSRPELHPWLVGSNLGPSIGALQTGGRHKIYNNIIYRSRANGIAAYNGTNDIKMYNNTVYNMLDGSPGLYTNATNVLIRNNLAYVTGGIVGGIQANNMTTNPSFINATNGDFKLQSGSAAIDSGMTVTEVTHDFAGVPRPRGASYDIGAYEADGTGQTGMLPPTGLTAQ